MEDDPVDEAMKYIRSPQSRDLYRRLIRNFLEWARLSSKEFVARAAADPKATREELVSFIEHLSGKGQSGGYIYIHIAALKCLLEENDVTTVNWRKVKRTIPAHSRFGKDRAPTVEEIRKILCFCDVRERMVVLAMAGGGFRAGAWPYLRVRDFSLIKDVGRLVIYGGEPEEYVTFLTPEAAAAVREYLALRERAGETLDQEVPLLRDDWNAAAGAGSRTATSLDSRAVGSLMFRILDQAGLRKREFKELHGFRKFFKTRMEQSAVKSIYVETLMGHSLGVSSSYMKPTETELLKEYLKAVPFLTIAESEELRGKLSIKEEELGGLRVEVNAIKETLGKIVEERKREKELEH